MYEIVTCIRNFYLGHSGERFLFSENVLNFAKKQKSTLWIVLCCGMMLYH